MADRAPERPTTILVVNDDDVARRITCEILRREFAVREAVDGAGALRLSQENPDLVVLDVKLPDRSGFDVCREIKATPATSLIPVLHLSAVHLDWRSKVTGLEGGADAYLTEPVEPPVLMAVVRALLRARRAEAEVLEAALEWQATFDAIEDGVALLDAEGRFLRYNGAMARILGASAEALGSRPAEELLAPSVRPEGGWLLDRARRSRRREALDVRIGGRTWLCAAHPRISSAGDMTGAVLVLVDVTERRALEERVQISQKLEAIGRLSSGVAHDFNNVLTVVQASAALLRDSVSSGDPRRVDLDDILEATRRGVRLVQQLQTFSRPAGSQPREELERKPIQLNDVLLGLDPMLRRILGAQIEVVTLPGAGLWSVDANPAQIETALMNLVVNARDAMPSGGKLTLATTNVPAPASGRRSEGYPAIPAGDWVLLSVTDDGVGMAEEIKRHLFEPFYTTKRFGEGSGLGLAMVHGIVSQAGGHILVESEPWKGSRFDVYLPRGEAAAAPAASPSAAPSPGSETVLVVEDEPAVRKVVIRTLRGAGYRVLEASHGEEALRLAQQPGAPRIDLLLTDVIMPKLSGRELAERFVVAFPGTPVLYMSGYTAGEFDADPVEGAEPRAFLQKPFTPTGLLAKVRETIDGLEPVAESTRRPR